MKKKIIIIISIALALIIGGIIIYFVLFNNEQNTTTGETNSASNVVTNINNTDNSSTNTITSNNTLSDLNIKSNITTDEIYTKVTALNMVCEIPEGYDKDNLNTYSNDNFTINFGHKENLSPEENKAALSTNLIEEKTISNYIVTEYGDNTYRVMYLENKNSDGIDIAFTYSPEKQSEVYKFINTL